MFIKVKVFSKEKKEVIIKKAIDSYHIMIKDKPEEGIANKKVREILSNYFRVNINQIKLVKGGKRRNKIFDIIK